VLAIEDFAILTWTTISYFTESECSSQQFSNWTCAALTTSRISSFWLSGLEFVMWIASFTGREGILMLVYYKDFLGFGYLLYLLPIYF
jgi:hypothetical protein